VRIPTVADYEELAKLVEMARIARKKRDMVGTDGTISIRNMKTGQLEKVSVKREKINELDKIVKESEQKLKSKFKEMFP